MQNLKSRWDPSGLAIIATFVVFGAAAFACDGDWWGSNHLAFLPLPLAVSLLVVGLLSTALLQSARSERVSHRFVVSLDRLLWGTARWPRIVLMVAAIALFVVFRRQTHFLGDGYTWLSNLGERTDYVLKWSEYGSIHLVRLIQQLLGGYTESTALMAFRFLSIASGAIVILNMIAIAGMLCRSAEARVVGLSTLLLSGSLLLFFGYVEFYPVSWAFCTTFVRLALEHLEGRRHLALVIGSFLIALLIHVQVVIFLAGVLLVVANRLLPSKRRLLPYAVPAGLTLVVAGVLVWFVNTRVDVETLLLPLLHGRPAAPEYTVLSLVHWFDLLQELMLVFPGAFVLLAAWLAKGAEARHSSVTHFLVSLSVGSLGFLFLYGAAITMGRDWDIMSLTLFAPVCLLLHQLDGRPAVLSSRLALSYVLLCLFAASSLLAVELRATSSAARFRSLLNARDRSSWVVLQDYYERAGHLAQARELGVEMDRAFPAFVQLNRAHTLIEKGDVGGALPIASRLVDLDPYNPDFLQVAGRVHDRLGRFEEAERYYRRAIQLRPHMPALRNRLGQILMNQQRYREAIAELKIARRMAPSQTNITESLGLAYAQSGCPDSASSVADTLFAGDPHSPGGHALMLVVSLSRGDTASARRHFAEYLKTGQVRSDYARMREYYAYLLR